MSYQGPEEQSKTPSVSLSSFTDRRRLGDSRGGIMVDTEVGTLPTIERGRIQAEIRLYRQQPPASDPLEAALIERLFGTGQGIAVEDDQERNRLAEEKFRSHEVFSSQGCPLQDVVLPPLCIVTDRGQTVGVAVEFREGESLSTLRMRGVQRVLKESQITQFIERIRLTIQQSEQPLPSLQMLALDNICLTPSGQLFLNNCSVLERNRVNAAMMSDHLAALDRELRAQFLGSGN